MVAAQATTNATDIESARPGASASAKTTAMRVSPILAPSTKVRTRRELTAASPHLSAKVTELATCGASVKENLPADRLTLENLIVYDNMHA